MSRTWTPGLPCSSALRSSSCRALWRACRWPCWRRWPPEQPAWPPMPVPMARCLEQGAGIVLSTQGVTTQLRTLLPVLRDQPVLTAELGRKARLRALERYTISQQHRRPRTALCRPDADQHESPPEPGHQRQSKTRNPADNRRGDCGVLAVIRMHRPQPLLLKAGFAPQHQPPG